MNCATCKVSIGPKTTPFGGFLCANEHLQCANCNTVSLGQCGICKDQTNFVQMNFNSYCVRLHDAQTRFAMSAVGQSPSAPPLSTQSNILSVGQQSTCDFPKKNFREIEIQSKISQEHLSMHDSKESLQENKSKLTEANETHLKSDEQILTNDNQCPEIIANKQNFDSMAGYTSKYANDQQNPNIETMFIGSTAKASSASNVGYTFYNVNNGVINGDPDIKVMKEKHHCQNNYEASKESGLKHNIFSFNEDSEDSNIINTSEIRFMDSTESLQNLFVNEPAIEIKTSIAKEMKHKPSPSIPQPEFTNGIRQQEILSINVLQNFEHHNTANSMEVVENYLRTYGPLAYQHFFPGCNCQHAYCHFGWEQQQMQNMAEYKKTACVSTDSAPSLKSHNVEKSTDMEITVPTKFKPQDFFVMQSLGVSKPEKDNKTLMEKFGRPSLDMRMQKLLETLQEDPKTQKIQEKPIELQAKGNYMKIPTAATKHPHASTENHITPIEIQQNLSINNDVPSTSTDSVLILQLLNTQRAYYNPPNDAVKPVNNLHTLHQPKPVSQEPPCSQFQTIPCSRTVVQELMMQKSRFLNKKPVPAYMLTIPRTPIKCPESTCQRMIFVSDFNKHLVVDHNHLPMERITPFQCKNFFLDPRLAQCGISKCHLLYLMRNQISDLGSSKYKDFLPLLVMTSRISLTQMCGLKQDSVHDSNDQLEYFLIWISGIVPEEFPISVSLTVWPRSGKVPSCHVVYSGDMYSIRQSQQGLDVWQSGRMLLLSSQELDLLTNGGKDMLNLQLMVH